MLALGRMVAARSTRASFRRSYYKAAVMLSGSGVYDGSEITEAVALLVGLSRIGASVQCFAPDRDQAHVVDHTSGEDQPDHKRNVLKESARIARGAVTPLSELNAADFDALFVPGGFGAAKNLCDFGFKGSEMTVEEDVKVHERHCNFACSIFNALDIF